ncbi:MAG: FG-GAP repeat protein [Alphaproteobacteria bacterium]|nr:FG-GAP repeat protein [Alphaproteobacteria bacterium]
MSALLLLLAACDGKDAPTDRTLDFDTTLPDIDSEPVQPVASCRAEGGALGPDTCVTEAPCAWSGDHSGAWFGASVAIGPDVNGDGVPDLAFGAPGYEPDRGTEDALNDAGRVVVVSGASLSEAEAPLVLGTFTGSSALAWTGSAVALPGDVNGDGVGDIWVGAMGMTASELANAGQLKLILGRAEGWDGAELSATTSVNGDAEYGRLGYLLEPAGDVNGDGLADTWATSGIKRFDGDRELSNSGSVHLLLGRTEAWTSGMALADADASITGASSSEELGRAMAGGGDLNGDGYVDLVVSGPYYSAYRGVVHLFPGGPEAFTPGMSASDAPVRLIGDVSYDYMGYDLAVGDFDGDGFDDLAVGIPLADEGGDGAGAVRIYAGSADAFVGEPVLLGAVLGEQDAGQLGAGLISGDVDGDGFEDLALGAVLTWRGLVTKGGRAYLLRGRAEGWPQGESVAPLDERAYGATVKDYLGDHGAMGDIDGDGKAELLLSTSYANLSGQSDVGGAWLFWGQ